VIDVDSFVGEVCGRLKQGAAYGYTKLLGYHPILATRADTREVLQIRLRKGSANTQKGIEPDATWPVLRRQRRDVLTGSEQMELAGAGSRPGGWEASRSSFLRRWSDPRSDTLGRVLGLFVSHRAPL
jgi:hypothetical protein